jgi:hypothetical protein
MLMCSSKRYWGRPHGIPGNASGIGTRNANPDGAGLIFQIELPGGNIILRDTATLVQRDPHNGRASRRVFSDQGHRHFVFRFFRYRPGLFRKNSTVMRWP